MLDIDTTYETATQKLELLRIKQLSIASHFDTCDLKDWWAIFADFAKVTEEIKNIRIWLELPLEENHA